MRVPKRFGLDSQGILGYNGGICLKRFGYVGTLRGEEPVATVPFKVLTGKSELSVPIISRALTRCCAMVGAAHHRVPQASADMEYFPTADFCFGQHHHIVT
jgi:hypothetical protein